MKRVLWSADKFDRKLASLFETLEGRGAELQAHLDQLVKGLLDGSVTSAPQHGPMENYDICCLPLIDRLVVVFRPNESVPKSWDNARNQVMLDFSEATRFDLLTIEEEPQ
jgi:hypothetical protein